MKHRSQPSGSRLQGWDKWLVWCESLPVHLVYLCTPTELSHFWHPWVGSTLQHPPNREEHPQSDLAVGAAAELQPSLNLPSLVVPGGKLTTFLPGWRHPHVWEGAPLVVYKWSPKQHDKDTVTSNQVVCFISCQGLCTHNEWPYPEFQFTATNFVSMAAKLTDLVDEMSGANLQTEGNVDVPTQGVKDWWELKALDGSPSHWPSWSLAQRLPSSCPNMKYCLEVHVTLTEELGAVPPPSHSWMALLVEDMLHDARTGLTKAVVTGPGRAVLFYGRHSMGEGLITDEARDAAFLLTGAGTWVGKSAYLATDPMTIQEGKRAIAQAVTDHQVKVMGPGHPQVNPLAQQPFQFNPPRNSPPKDASGDCSSNYPPSPHWPSRGQECNRHQRDQRPQSPWFPSPSPDCGFESDRSSLLTTSLMLSRSDQSDGSRHSRQGRPHREEGACMKINLPIFKDEDAKDAVTYQSWRWDLTVYWHVQGAGIAPSYPMQ